MCFNGVCACVCGGGKKGCKGLLQYVFSPTRGQFKKCTKKRVLNVGQVDLFKQKRKLQQKPTTFWGEFSRQKFISLDSDLKQF